MKISFINRPENERTKCSKPPSPILSDSESEDHDDTETYLDPENIITSNDPNQAQTSPTPSKNPEQEGQDPQIPTTTLPIGTKINLTLRIRSDYEGQLNDIKFPFVMGTDTAESLAHELCEAQLVNITDQIRVSEALSNVIATGGDQTFMLDMSGAGGEVEVNFEDLIGYARLSLDTSEE